MLLDARVSAVDVGDVDGAGEEVLDGGVTGGGEADVADRGRRARRLQGHERLHRGPPRRASLAAAA